MERTEIINKSALLEVRESRIDDSRFTKAMLGRLRFEDVNMTGTKIINANLSDLEIEGAQLGGAYIHNIGMPPVGHPLYDPAVKQRPLRFEDCDLSRSGIENCNLSESKIQDCNLGGTKIQTCNLSGVELTDCNIQGMKINGVLVEELLSKKG